MIRERVLAGLARARAEGRRLGRRPVEQSKMRKVRAALTSFGMRRPSSLQYAAGWVLAMRAIARSPSRRK